MWIIIIIIEHTKRQVHVFVSLAYRESICLAYFSFKLNLKLWTWIELKCKFTSWNKLFKMKHKPKIDDEDGDDDDDDDAAAAALNKLASAKQNQNWVEMNWIDDNSICFVF